MSRPYIEKAKVIYNYHRQKFIENPKWRVIDTARALRISAGSTTESLMIAKALSNFPELEKIDTAYEALKFLRKNKQQTTWEEI